MGQTSGLGALAVVKIDVGAEWLVQGGNPSRKGDKGSEERLLQSCSIKTKGAGEVIRKKKRADGCVAQLLNLLLDLLRCGD